MTDTVVVGIDDSDGARAALAWAVRHAASTGCRLRVVHVYELNLAWIDVYNESIPQWEKRARDAAEGTLSRVANDVLEGSQLDAIQLEAIEGSARLRFSTTRHVTPRCSLSEAGAEVDSPACCSGL
jgi:nucleotide-binding universal stress UspA family protein